MSRDTLIPVLQSDLDVMAAERNALREALRNWRTWFAEHMGDFDPDTECQLLCLDNESAFALKDES